MINDTEATQEILNHLQIDALNEMQIDFIEKAKHHQNLMLLAPTGSGKTLAYLFPLLEILQADLRAVQALIIVPSRELAIQIEQVFKSMKTPFKVSTCYGGHAMKIEQNSLGEGPALVIGTPGRLKDHIEKESFDPSSIQVVILDEFDKSLQLGFHDQIRNILRPLTSDLKYFLTSATKMDRLPEFIPFSNPETANFLQDEKDSKLKLKLVNTPSIEKAETLMRLVAEFNNEACIVFCNHRDAVDRISTLLNDYDFHHGILHGGMEQIDREKNLIKFRSGAHNLLIATDLASRGLDIPEIKHVVHYQLPPKVEAFTHRNGRTARMHAEGQGYLILANDELLPDYIDKDVEEIYPSQKFVSPDLPEYECLYISAGKKDKISKGDIVGLLTKKGGLEGSDIGVISILDFSAYVAVKRNLATKVLKKVHQEKLKKIKVKVALAN
ncbi:DNA/RNA helicase, superfamily II [Belliella baltica DSM 15883]|uniref:DNA/RNA helicase, superfamily II n=1 Tax=Belliella baltica (strain DSM 15883 / CIP 108006 / LMG 21964 / BA134) TaxID=866536 RepID=I3Z964_BELBD|nr:DEAD/DEAH box helicase [Belliella baltica]AFL85782.1 DNA/RNA helicase, superfamily II [Belliella baltica DSM 15883]